MDEGREGEPGKLELISNTQIGLARKTMQGSKFVVAMVANATMFSHLLPGCSCGSKHLLLPYNFGIVNLVHVCIFV